MRLNISYWLSIDGLGMGATHSMGVVQKDGMNS